MATVDASTLPRPRAERKGFSGQFPQPSALIRATAAMQRESAAAAALMEVVIGGRVAKQFAPYLGPNEIGELRNRGGAVAKVCHLFHADPRTALWVAEHIHGRARHIANAGAWALDVTESARVAQRAVSAVSISAGDILAQPDHLHLMHQFLLDTSAAIAALRRSYDAVADHVALTEAQHDDDDVGRAAGGSGRDARGTDQRVARRA